MDFQPNMKDNDPFDVPYYEEVDSGGGWVGHTTGQSIDDLEQEVKVAMARIGAVITTFQEGVFGGGSKKPREGYLINYSLASPSGEIMYGRVKIAALPVKIYNGSNIRKQGGYETKKEKSLKMALYMFRNSINGMWYLEKLSPGYMPLMPWMLNEKTDMTWGELFIRNQVPMLSESNDEEDAVIVDFIETE